jgi:nucleoside-diphosphate-sugar epimerase
MILITGSAGLVGRHLGAQLRKSGHAVRTFDLRHADRQDVSDGAAVERAIAGVRGIVHLAAVSRVVDGERDPQGCQRTNIGGLKTLLNAALVRPKRPWFVFVSSREVYGNAALSPTQEDCPYNALNTYARSKVEGERLVDAAREAGLLANICRLSTVYGSVEDHADRVLPAFCRAAAIGGKISVQGRDIVLDPTHVDDVAAGLALLIAQCAAGELLPPIHFVSGRGASLLELADLAVARGQRATRIAVDPPRAYDVQKFVGDPRRAKALLGWEARTDIETGIAAFIRDFERLESELNAPPETLALAV